MNKQLDFGLFDFSNDYDAEATVEFYGKAYDLEELLEVVNKLVNENYPGVVVKEK